MTPRPHNPQVAPHRPRAMDLACGSGREAVHLALLGYDVDAVDLLPDALARAADLAARSGARINPIRLDLRTDPLPAGPYDLVLVFRFLHRPMLPRIADALAPGGWLVYETFHASDPHVSPTHAAADGELAGAFADLDIRIARDGVTRCGRTFSQLLARKSPGTDRPPAS